MEADSGIKIKELHVDGGASSNNLLMQFQSEAIDCPVVRPKQIETTALGAAYLAGLAVGYWKDMNELHKQWQQEKVFKPVMDKGQIGQYRRKWQKAVQKAKDWMDGDD